MHFHTRVAQFLFKDTQNCVLFPSASLRNAFVKNAAKELGACAEGQHILFCDVQERMCMYIAHALEKPLRILTFAERSVMYESFLVQQDIQRAVARLENCPHGSDLQDTSYQQYVPKLERILGHYSLIHALKHKDTGLAHNTYKTVTFIAQRYYDFVLDFGCIDYACATIALCERHVVFNREQAQKFWHRIFVFAPAFFSLAQHAWFEHFDITFAQPLCYNVEAVHEKTVVLNKLQNTETHEQAVQYTNAFFAKTPQSRHNYMFATVAEELNWACSGAAKLQEGGVLAQDIAFSISEMDTFIQAELHSLCAKYDIEINMEHVQNTHSGAVLHAFLQSIQECVHAYMHPEALKKLLLFPFIPWNNREGNIELVKLGLRHACIDDNDLERWRTVLGSVQHREQLRAYFFSLHKTLRAMVKARTYRQLHQAFESLTHDFMHVQSTSTITPFFGQTMHRILEIVYELTIQEQHLCRNVEEMQVFKSANPWSVLCSIALRRSTTFSKKEHSISIYEFPASVGTYYKYHFFLGFSQGALKKVSMPPVLFHKCIDDEIFEHSMKDGAKTHAAKMAEHYKNAIEMGGEHVFISTSREDYKGMRIIPIDWTFEEGPVPRSVSDPWAREQRLWAEDAPCLQEFMNLQCTELQRKGMHAQQHTRHAILNTNAGMLLPSTKEIIRRHFAGSTVAIGDIAMLMTDPVYFVLRNGFSITPLFPDLQENFDMPLMVGNMFHTILARIFSDEVDSASIHGIIQEVLETTNAHVFVHMSLRRMFETKDMEHYIMCIKDFIHTTMMDLDCRSVKTEEPCEVLLGEMFPWAEGVLSMLRVRGRSDVLLCSMQDEVRCIVDYKTKMRTPLSYFAQLWMYAMVHGHGRNNATVNHELFLLLKNLKNAQKQKELLFQSPSESIAEHIKHYDVLLKNSLAYMFCDEQECEDMRVSEGMRATHEALAKELFQDIAYISITREHCYVYQNYISHIEGLDTHGFE